MAAEQDATDGAPERFPGGGHRTLADAAATALQWAAHLPEGTLLNAVGFGGGEREATSPPWGQLRSYWWSAAARLDIGGGLSSGQKRPMTPDEARRFNVQKVLDSAVEYAQTEARVSFTESGR